MPRLRGPMTERPHGESAWPILNEHLFGDQGIGGHDRVVRSEVLPLDWSRIFGREAPLSLEIGFNRGRFLTELAQNRPEEDFVGIEVRRRFCWRLANLLGTRPDQPKNLRIIWADAKLVSRAIFGAGALDKIFITFPDPWWKKRHAKRRLVDTRFASELSEVLRVGGRIYVKSDVEAISQEIAESLASVPELGAPVPFAQEDWPLTHRERKCVEAEMKIWRYSVERLDD